MAQTVIGIFDYTNEAQAAINYLVSNGFSRDNIDVSARDESQTDDGDNNGWGEGISSFFSNLFGNDNDDAKKYSEVGRRGSIVTVHAQSSEEAERAARILDDYGAIDVDDRHRQYSHAENHGGTAEARSGLGGDTALSGTGGASMGTGIDMTTDTGMGTDSDITRGSGNLAGGDMLTGSRSGIADDDLTRGDIAGMGTGDITTSGTGTTTGMGSDAITTGNTGTTADLGSDLTSDRDITSDRGTDKSIPIIEENLEVGKRVVESGTTRLRSRIVERPVEESIRLRSERVNVERTPVNRPATAADLENFSDKTIEATEHTEVPVVGKESRVVEEVSLNKEVDEREETIRDTVRSTEIDVDSDNNANRSVSDDIIDSDDDDDINRRGNTGYTDSNTSGNI